MPTFFPSSPVVKRCPGGNSLPFPPLTLRRWAEADFRFRGSLRVFRGIYANPGAAGISAWLRNRRYCAFLVVNQPGGYGGNTRRPLPPDNNPGCFQPFSTGILRHLFDGGGFLKEDFSQKFEENRGITGIGRLMEKGLVNWKELKSCWIISKGLRNWKIVWLRPQLVRFSQRKIRIFPVTILSGSEQSTPTVFREVTSALSRDIATAPIKISLSFFHLSFSTPINLVLAAPDRHAPLRLITKRGENTKWNPRIKISFSSLSWFKKWTNIYIYNRS